MKKAYSILVVLLSLTFMVNSQTFNPFLANKLQKKIDSFRVASNLKGISAAVIYPEIGTWKGVTGISHTGFPITSEMEFGIASNTKLFTGVLLLKLAEKKIINLDDALHQHLPNFKNVNPNITIRQLLNHTSGIADVNNIPGYVDSILSNPNHIYTPKEVMNWVGSPLFPAGTSWNYSNTNYILAGLIAESATGKSYGQLLRDSILSPLKLDSTFLDVHEKIPYTIAHPWQNGVDKFSTPRKSLNSVAWAAGAMYSTSGEMASWYNALMNGKVLKQSSFDEMTTFVGSGNYGIGLYSKNMFGRTLWLHGGTIWGGYNSSMIYDTSTGIVICVLINQLPAQAFQVSTELLSTLINQPVSITENTILENKTIVYPNPTEGFFDIKIPNQVILNITIYDFQGRLIKETTENRIDLSPFADGVYFIKAQTEKGFYGCQIMKQ